MEPRIQYAKTDDGVNIAYTVLGAGPAIVMTSVAFGDVNTFASGGNPEFEQLAEAGRRVAFYDGRGTGSSDRSALDFSLEARVADLEGVVDRLGVESFVLVGRIHGGAPAVAYAVSHPNRVSHLVLWNAHARGSDYYTVTVYTRAITALAGMAEADWEFFTLNLAHWAVGFRDAERAHSLAAAFKNGMSTRAYLRFVDASQSVDVSAMLPKVSVPTLVIQQGRAVLSAPELARPLASEIPGAQLVSVRGRDAAAKSIIEFTALQAETPATIEAGPSSGLVTVLFTDLAGSTAMMQRLGDELGREVLREHERITREVLKSHGGAEVKTMGDGFMASFGSVTKAVECAIALQRAFAQREGEPLSVRIGLNAGEPIEEEGDLFGATVILASRIAAKAEGGEILASDVVRGLCSGKGFLFADRGEFVAKGFEEPVRLYEIRWRPE